MKQVIRRPEALDGPSTVQMIAIELLNIPPYQRPPEKPLIAKIGREWCEAACSLIVISHRADGSYWIVDGQQRTLGTTIRHGVRFLMRCLVYEGLSYQDEIDLFIFLNGWRKAVPVWVMMSARFDGGREDTVAIVSLLDRLGLSWSWRFSPHGFCCWCMLHAVNTKYGLDHLTKTLTIIRDAWPEETQARIATFVGAVALFLDRHQKVADLPTLARRLGRTRSDEIMEAAGADHRRKNGPSMQTALYRRLIDAHDYMLRNRIRNDL